jgi:hypothetical protein
MSGDLASSFLFSQIKGSTGSKLGESSDSEMIDDVLINPGTLTLSMLGNVCMTRGQNYFVDFNTGTTLDNAYAVTSVSHNLSPGKFTTSVTMMTVNSATMKSLATQLQELVVIAKDSTGTDMNPSKPASST